MDPAVQFPTSLTENQAGQLPFLTIERKKGGRKSTALSGLGTILSNLTNRAQRQACPEEREKASDDDSQKCSISGLKGKGGSLLER